MPDKANSRSSVFDVNVISGLLTGSFCTALFNPWDRALYLAAKHNRPFLSKENFVNPYQGVVQAVSQRAILGSVYYIVQAELKQHLRPYLHDIGYGEVKTQFFIGFFAGSMHGLLTSNISFVKHYTWGKEGRTFRSSVNEMWMAGVRTFFRGMNATIARDIVFGSTYETLRFLMHNSLASKTKENHFLEFACNVTTAGVAAIAAGPLNHARIMQYGTPLNQKPPTIGKALKDVWIESKKFTGWKKCVYFPKRFNVGWGTLRVAAGTGVAQLFFNNMQAVLMSATDKQEVVKPSKKK